MDPNDDPEHVPAAAAAAAVEAAGGRLTVAGVMDPLHPQHNHHGDAGGVDAADAAHQAAEAASVAYDDDSDAVAVAVAAANDFVGISNDQGHGEHDRRAAADPQVGAAQRNNMEIDHREHQHSAQRDGGEAAAAMQDRDGDESGRTDRISKRRRLSHGTGMEDGGVVEEEATTVDGTGTSSGSSNGRRKNPSFPPPKKLNQEQWDTMFNRLIAYKDKYGDTLVAKRFVDDPKLGTWVETQRVQYKKCLARSREVAMEQGIMAPGTPVDALIPGRDYAVIPSKRLNAERLSRLNEIDFAWSARPGRSSSRRSSIGIGIGIGIGGTSGAGSTAASTGVVAAATTAFSDAGDGKPTHESAALAAAGGVNNVEHALAPASPSMTAAAATVDAVDINSAHVDAAAIEAAAVADHAMDGAHIEEDHYQQQESPPLEQNPHQHQHERHHQQADSASDETNFEWDDMYERLVAFKERFGNCLVPERYPDDVQLAQWVEHQRMHYKAEGNINNDRKKEVAAPSAAEHLLHVQESIEPAHVDPLAPMDDTGLQGVAHEAGLGDMDAEGDADDNADGHMRSNDGQAATAAERWAKLDAIGFVWNVRGKKLDDQWDTMLNQLLQYKHAHGDTLVPCKWKPNPKLGKWVEAQRYEYTKLLRAREDAAKAAAAIASGTSDRHAADGAAATTTTGATSITRDMPNGKKKRPTNSRLTEERVTRLENIGFQWKVKNKMKKHYEKQWQDTFQQLLHYKEEHGDCNVPRNWTAQPKLGSWVYTQRVLYRKFQEVRAKEEAGQKVTAADTDLLNRLTEKRRQKLEEAGFDWALKELAPKKRPAPSQSRSKSRSGVKKRSRTASRKATATRVSYDKQWDVMFERLRQYKENKGDCLVPKRFAADKQLGTWVDTQRVQYKKLQKVIAGAESQGGGNDAEKEKKQPRVGRLTPERIAKLESLGFVWSLRDNWDKHYQELVQYHAEHGDCFVPAKYPQNHKLGIWVSAQRQVYKLQMAGKDISALRTAKLTPERIAALNSIGFAWALRSRDALSDIRSRRSPSGRSRKPSKDDKTPSMDVPASATSVTPIASNGIGPLAANDSEALTALPGVDPISVHGAVPECAEAGQSDVTMAETMSAAAAAAAAAAAGFVASTAAETVQLAEDIAQGIIADVETENAVNTAYI